MNTAMNFTDTEKPKRIFRTTVYLLTVLTVLSISNPTLAQNSAQTAPQNGDYDAILQEIDANTRFESDFTATVRLEEQDPREGDETYVAQTFRRDAEDKFLLLFQRPEVQLGQGYLNIEDGLWFYDPESRQFSYTSLSEALAGSDARNSDFQSSSLSEDYDVVAAEEGTLGRFEVWILDLEATNDEVTYPRRKLWVSKDLNLVLKSEDYSLSGRLLRTSYFPSYTRVGGNFVADEQLYVDALTEGAQTRLTLSNISTTPIPDNVFTRAYVERVNR